MLIVLFSLVSFFFNSSFIFTFKGVSESITKTNLTLPDYMFTIRYFIKKFKHLFLLLSGNIEINPFPKRSSNIKLCPWNLNVIAVHDVIKVSLLEACNKQVITLN